MKTGVKINLGLRVLSKRPDGFHELETLFVPSDAFGDELSVVPSGEFAISIEGCDWDPSEDLTARAWRLMRDEFGIPPVSIRLTKGAPVGAGLGGGSADAAATLRMLNELFRLGLSDRDLALRASRLGSDCAFFVYNRPMFGTGRGEILEPFDLDLSGYEIKVEVPAGVAVSTAEAYRGVLSARRNSMPLREALACPVEQWKEVLVNDFENTVFAAYPEIAALKRRFYENGAVYASMSGSGSSVFALFRRKSVSLF